MTAKLLSILLDNDQESSLRVCYDASTFLPGHDQNTRQSPNKMGRQQYLTRLALGRSAFEPVKEQEPPRPDSHQNQDGDHVQQYDSKGRPINPKIDAFNAEMRKAQNDVLSLVGVVERKDLTEKNVHWRNRVLGERRLKLLQDEQEKGELLDYAFLPVTFLAHLWTDALIQKVQIGFFDPGRSIVDVLASECRGLAAGGVRCALARMFPGFGDIVLHTIVRLPLIVAVEQLTGRIQSSVQKRRFKRKTAKRLYTAISFFFEAALLGIDMALLPMEFHARAQRLGLAPPLPLFPPLKSFLPWHATSFHQFGWKPLFGITVVKSLTTPAVLLLLYKIFHWDADENEIPICGIFTAFRYPAIDSDPSLTPSPKAKDDLTGWMMHKSWTLRTRILQWCGWDMVQTPSPRPLQYGDERLENNTRQRYEGTPDEQNLVHRSTALAQLPAQRLASSIDMFLSRLITIPFESLMLRSVARACLLHAPTPSVLAAAPHIYPPFSGGPISQLLRAPKDFASWSSAGTYASHLGLALALDTSVDVLLFFGVYASTKYVGRRYFSWRTRRKGRDDRDHMVPGERRRIGE